MRKHLRGELIRLKEEIAEFRTRYRRYLPPDLKRRAGRLAAKLEAQGWSLDGVAEELGVTLVTLRRWRDGASEAGAALVPVEVEQRAEQSSGLVLVSPSGWRVENIDLHTAVDLLREVGS